jgi:transcriptional antiterminator RfaH
MSMAAVSETISWYLVQTKPRQEFRALEQLENQGYRCYLPTLQIERVVRGNVKRCVEPLFSRYLFIQLDTSAGDWSPIRSTRGVSRLVAFGTRLATLPDTCVEALRKGQETVHRPLFEHGERVTITTGALAGLDGIYDMPDGDARALVLIELLNQPHRLKFAVDALRKAA